MFSPVRDGGLDLEWLSSRIDSVEFILEIGANSGTDTLRMLEHFPNAQIMCFEPDPRAIKLWKETVSDPRAMLDEIAVSEKSGELLFFQSSGIPPGFNEEDFPEGWHLSGSVVKPKNHTLIHEWSDFSNQISVTSRTLDEITASRRELSPQKFPIDLIWADVQGAEEGLIVGGEETLKRTKFFYTEFSNDELYTGQPTLRRLMKLLPNFNLKRLWKNDVLFENKTLVQR